MSKCGASWTRQTKLEAAAQARLDGLVRAKGSLGAASALGVTPTAIDRLAFGGGGSAELVARVEAALEVRRSA